MEKIFLLHAAARAAGTCIDISDFERLSTTQSLAQDLRQVSEIQRLEDADIRTHILPKGSIIDYYGTCKCSNIPYGYVPCGRFLTGTDAQVDAEINLWKARYKNSITTIKEYQTSGDYTLQITQCNGQIVPDLTDRFIVQAGGSYPLAQTGGETTHQLTLSEIPSHNHSIGLISDMIKDKVANSGADENEYVLRGLPKQRYTGANGGGTSGTDAHENRPPFYALYKLIKVI